MIKVLDIECNHNEYSDNYLSNPPIIEIKVFNNCVYIEATGTFLIKFDYEYGTFSEIMIQKLIDSNREEILERLIEIRKHRFAQAKALEKITEKYEVFL
jgi:hypothetical protein